MTPEQIAAQATQRCPRCRSTMLYEPFSDPSGRGHAWSCLACGERKEQMVQRNDGAMTEAELAELMKPQRAGRPPGGTRKEVV